MIKLSYFKKLSNTFKQKTKPFFVFFVFFVVIKTVKVRRFDICSFLTSKYCYLVIFFNMIFRNKQSDLIDLKSRIITNDGTF